MMSTVIMSRDGWESPRPVPYFSLPTCPGRRRNEPFAESPLRNPPRDPWGDDAKTLCRLERMRRTHPPKSSAASEDHSSASLDFLKRRPNAKQCYRYLPPNNLSIESCPQGTSSFTTTIRDPPSRHPPIASLSRVNLGPGATPRNPPHSIADAETTILQLMRTPKKKIILNSFTYGLPSPENEVSPEPFRPCIRVFREALSPIQTPDPTLPSPFGSPMSKFASPPRGSPPECLSSLDRQLRASPPSDTTASSASPTPIRKAKLKFDLPVHLSNTYGRLQADLRAIHGSPSP